MYTLFTLLNNIAAKAMPPTTGTIREYAKLKNALASMLTPIVDSDC